MKFRLLYLLFAAGISMLLVGCGAVDDTLPASEADILVNDGAAAAEGQSSTPDAEATPPIGDADATSQPPLADGEREDVKAGEEPPEDAGDKAPPGAERTWWIPS